MRRINRSQVEIFNFSFLDILACTIALLIFILVMVFVLQSGSTALADTSKIVQRATKHAASLESQAKADDRLASQLEGDIEHLSSMVDRGLLAARAAAKDHMEKAQILYDGDQTNLITLKRALEDALSVHDELNQLSLHVEAALAQAKVSHAEAERQHAELMAQMSDDHVLVRPVKALDDAGADSTVLHIDCQRDKVVVMKLPADGKVEILGSTPTNDLDAQNSVFATAVEQHKNTSKPVIVFWVRPDGLETFSKAKEFVPAGVDYGYEPAAPDWKFSR